MPSDSATPGAARSSDRVDPVSDTIPIEFPALSESSGVGWEQATKGGPEMIGKRSTIAMTGSTLLLLAGGGAAYAASQQSSQHALPPGWELWSRRRRRRRHRQRPREPPVPPGATAPACRPARPRRAPSSIRRGGRDVRAPAPPHSRGVPGHARSPSGRSARGVAFAAGWTPPDLRRGVRSPEKRHLPALIWRRGLSSMKGRASSRVRLGPAWVWFAGSLTVSVGHGWLQSSIRSRWADQSVVRCSGAQSSGRPSWVSEAMTNSELARAFRSRRGRGRKPVRVVRARRRSCGVRQLLFRARPAAAR